MEADRAVRLLLDPEGKVDEQTLAWWTARVAVVGECVEWQRARSSDGYGSIGGGPRSNRRNVGAHRHAYETLVGPIPDGLRVLHSCDNPPCVRPSHLFLGTQADNVRDAIEKGRHRNVRRRTHCPRGHEVSGDNAYEYRGYLRCRACHRDNERQRRKERKTA